MPLYDYRCKRCGETYEVRQRFADEPLQTHEGCGGEVERLISAPALQFKGTGWYVTDYARGGKSSNGKDEAPKTDAAKTETKSDSKTETTKSESKPAASKASTE